MESIRREVVLAAPPDRVWAALTEPEHLSAWFGAEVTRSGAHLAFRMEDGVERRAGVETVEAERVLLMRWLPFERDPGGETRPFPPSAVRFVLSPEGSGTRLVVSEEPLGPHTLEAEPAWVAPGTMQGPQLLAVLR